MTTTGQDTASEENEMTNPIGGVSTHALHIEHAAQQPAPTKDPDHDGDVDGAGVDKDAAHDPLRTSVRIDTSA
jgi:hypothetical protein